MHVCCEHRMYINGSWSLCVLGLGWNLLKNPSQHTPSSLWAWFVVCFVPQELLQAEACSMLVVSLVLLSTKKDGPQKQVGQRLTTCVTCVRFPWSEESGRWAQWMHSASLWPHEH